MAEATNPLLSVRNLSVDFASKSASIPVVRSASFDVMSSDVFAVVGESGSGKSTLAQALLRVIPPPALITGGQVLCEGRDVLAMRQSELRHVRWRQVSLVLQSAIGALNPVLRIGEQIADGILAHERVAPGELDDRVVRLLKDVSLEASIARRYPHELSGGMRQRVGIAMALALRPPLVVMDEPTTALDAITAARLVAEIVELRKRFAMAVLLVTHDWSVLPGLATQLAVMHAGRIVEQGPVGTVLSNPKHPFTQQILSSMSAGLGVPKGVPSSRHPQRTGTRLTPVLELAGLEKSFRLPRAGTTRAVDNVSLKVFAGEIVAVVGESGSGKSTLGRLITRLTRPSQGTLLFKGMDVLQREPRPSRAYRRNVQMIFQDPFSSLNPHRTVRAHLAAAIAPGFFAAARVPAPQIERLLESVGLTPAADFLDRYPHELSGGQRQRVAIARALATEPCLIIADEPTSMLDLTLRKGILSLLERLRDERGIAYLLITHDLRAAMQIADRVIVMYQGRIVEHGSAEDVLSAPDHPYTRQLVAAAS